MNDIIKPMFTYQIELKDVEETLNAGKNLALLLEEFAKNEEEDKINLLLLFGTLGAGKTTFTRGFVSALSNAHHAEVASPTFALVNHYPTKPAVIHADMYRLAEMADISEGSSSYPDMPEDLEEAIFEEDSHNGYILIEWAEFLDRAQLPKERLDIFLKIHNNAHILELYGYTLYCESLFDNFHKLMNSLSIK